jgi:DNA-binding Lrp family transcriptional regulator
MTIVEVSRDEGKFHLYNSKVSSKRKPGEHQPGISLRLPTSRSTEILKLLLQNGSKKTVYSVPIGQVGLAKELQITRQTLSLHFKKLREYGLIQVGRDFINVTEEGLEALGYRRETAIVNVRVLPQKRSEAVQKISELPATEVFRVVGDVDVVLIIEQERLDHILEALSHIDGVVETKSLVSIACDMGSAQLRERAE